jgi:hypothetical protein
LPFRTQHHGQTVLGMDRSDNTSLWNNWPSHGPNFWRKCLQRSDLKQRLSPVPFAEGLIDIRLLAVVQASGSFDIGQEQLHFWPYHGTLPPMVSSSTMALWARTNVRAFRCPGLQICNDGRVIHNSRFQTLLINIEAAIKLPNSLGGWLGRRLFLLPLCPAFLHSLAYPFTSSR